MQSLVLSVESMRPRPSSQASVLSVKSSGRASSAKETYRKTVLTGGKTRNPFFANLLWQLGVRIRMRVVEFLRKEHN